MVAIIDRTRVCITKFNFNNTKLVPLTIFLLVLIMYNSYVLVRKINNSISMSLESRSEVFERNLTNEENIFVILNESENVETSAVDKIFITEDEYDDRDKHLRPVIRLHA